MVVVLSINDSIHGFETSVVAGLLLMLCGTVLQNLGLGFQKLAHARELTRPEHLRVSYWSNRQWWIAFGMFILGAVMDFCALGLIPASVALPIGSVGLVVSSVFAARYLNENFTGRDKVGTLLIIVGSWSAVLFSRKLDERITAENLMDRLDVSRLSGVYVMVVVAWTATVIAVHKYRYRNALIASIIPGSFGAFGNIGGKGTAELIKISLKGENQFGHFFTWCFVAFTVAMLIVQNHWLQAALQGYDQVIVVPVYYVAVCMASVLGGVLFFGEWAETTPDQDVLFSMGVLVIFLGVWILTLDHLRPEYLLAKDMGMMSAPGDRFSSQHPPPLQLASIDLEDEADQSAGARRATDGGGGGNGNSGGGNSEQGRLLTGSGNEGAFDTPPTSTLVSPDGIMNGDGPGGAGGQVTSFGLLGPDDGDTDSHDEEENLVAGIEDLI